MALTDTTRKIVYTTGTTSFTFPFKIYATTDLLVYLYNTTTKAYTLLALTTDYTVALTTDAPSAGTITLLVARPAGSNVIIQGNTALTQEIVFVDDQAVPAATQNKSLDKLTMIVQELLEKINRCGAVGVEYDTFVAGIVDNFSLLSSGIPASYLDTDGTLAGNSDVRLATQKATKTYADTKAPLTAPSFTGIVTASAQFLAGDGSAAHCAFSFMNNERDDVGFFRYNDVQIGVSLDSRHSFTFVNNNFTPVGAAYASSGASSEDYWNFIYAAHFSTVADWFNFDDKDDVGDIEKIKGSGNFDQFGREIISDSTLPDYILTKHEETGEAKKNEDGKPWIDLNAAISLCFGAIRQLSATNKDLQSRVDSLEARLTKLEGGEICVKK